ncbi:MAG: Gfo/Idh/MocA family oxidoreductase [Ignavibacteria bacterium]|nr:Gfo/Idh/MocA family oxidoreductase [Ignavibacteria bacterium]
MSTSVGLALIGAGSIAQSIHLPLLTAMPGVKIISIADKQVTKARMLAERYKIDYVTRNAEDAITQPGVDGVIITTSTDVHAEIALIAMRHGKHVFIERPAARTLQETIDIKTCAVENGVQVMVGMNHRFRPDIVHMKNAISRGEIGKVFYVKAGWVKQRSTDARWIANADKSGGGVLIDLGVAVIDMILHVLDFGRVRSVVANTYHQETTSVEDVVVAMLLFENGSVATIETSWSLMRAEDLYYCNVFGKKGSAFINPFKLVKRVGNEFETTQPQQLKSHLAVYKKSYESEFKHFVSGVKGLVPMISTIDDAVERMKIVEALYVSAELKKEIVIV